MARKRKHGTEADISKTSKKAKSSVSSDHEENNEEPTTSTDAYDLTNVDKSWNLKISSWNVNGLKAWIQVIPQTTDNGISHYLWDKRPKNQKADKAFEDHQLEKTCTYYTHLDGTAGQTEHHLIYEFTQLDVSGGCMNVQKFGNESETGIVYVLVYKQPGVDEESSEEEV